MKINVKWIFIFVPVLCFLSLSNVYAVDGNSTDLLLEDSVSEPLLNENNGYINDSRTDTYLNSSNLIKYYKGSENYGVYLYDDGGNVLVNKSINFTIKGVSYSRVSNDEGYASLAINLNSGNYSVSCFFNGDEYYKPCNSTNWVFVNSTIWGDDLVKHFRNSSQYYCLFFSVNGVALVNTTVTFNINGVFYNRTTNSSGWARLNINLEPGEYIITAINPVSGEMHSNNITVLPILIAEDLHMNYKDGSCFEVIVLDNMGNPFPNQTVSFNINGVFYNRTSDIYGVARLNINLMQGEYIITSSFNNMVISNNIFIYDNGYTNNKSFNLISDDVNFIYNSNSSFFIVYLKDNQGNPVSSRSVLLNVGNYSSASLTNSDGLVKWFIDWNVGVYNVVVSFNFNRQMISNDYYIVISKSNVVLDNNSHLSQYYNYSLFSVKACDYFGHYLSGLNISFNINNCTFFNVTNEEGIAFCSFDLDIGKYILNVSFEGNNNFNPSFLLENITVMGSVFVSNESGFYNQSNLTVNIVSNFSDFYYSFDNISWYMGYDNISILFMNGEWDLYYCNNLSNVYHCFYIVDNVSPFVFSNYGSGIYNESFFVNLTAFDNVDDNPLIYYSLNNSSYILYNGSIFISNSSYTSVLRFFSIDRWGHNSNIVRVNYFFGELIANLDSGKYYFDINSAIDDNDTHFGDIIEVSCDLNETLILNKSIYLKSCNFREVIWVNDICCISINQYGSNSIVEGFIFNTLQNSYYAICLGNVQYCLIQNNVFYNYGLAAIYSIGNNYHDINIVNNIFDGNSYTHILITDFAENFCVSDNQFLGNFSYGIRCFDIENSLFMRNQISNALNFGIYVSGYNNTIIYNNFTHNNCAIYIVGSNSRIISNIISYNNIGIYLNVNNLDMHFNSIVLNNRSIYSINPWNVDATNNWWGLNNSMLYSSDFNISLVPFLCLNVYASSYKIDNGVVYGGTVCCDLTYNSYGYETSNLGLIPDNLVVNFNNECYGEIVNGKVFFDTSIKDNYFEVYLDNVTSIFSFDTTSFAHIVINSSALKHDSNESLYFEYDLFLNDSVDWVSVVWKNKGIFESEINLIVNGEIVNIVDVDSSYYGQIRDNVSVNLINALCEYNKFIENSFEYEIAVVYVWLALNYNLTNLEDANYIRLCSNWSNFTKNVLDDLLDVNNLTFDDVLLNLIKNSYNLTDSDILFIRENHDKFKDKIYINVDYLGDFWEEFNINNGRVNKSYYWKGDHISRVGLISFVDGSYAHTTGETSNFVENRNITHLSNGTILWENGYSEGYMRQAEYDGLMSFCFANTRVDNSILAYWLNQKGSFSDGFMKAYYGSFLEGLLVIYCSDLVADASALRFNVTWNRTSPMVISVRDDLYHTFLSGECNFHFGRSVYGEEENIKAFNFACSSFFSPIEHYVSKVLFPNEGKLGSVTFGLGHILTHNGALEIVQEGNYLLIRENGSDKRVLLYDFSTGLLHDQLHVNLTGAYCYSNQQTEWAWDFGEELLNYSSQILDLIVNGTHDIMDHVDFLDNVPDWLLGIVGSAAICLGVAALATNPVGWCIGAALIIGGIYAIYYSDDLNKGWNYEKGAWFVFDVVSSIPFGVYKSGAIVGEVILKEYSIKNTNIIIKYSDDTIEFLSSFYSLTKSTITYEPYGTLKSMVATGYGTTNLLIISGELIFNQIKGSFLYHPFVSKLINILNDNFIGGNSHV